MAKVGIILAIFVAATVHGIEERQSSHLCPANYLNATNAQVESIYYNYGCIVDCQYTSGDATTGFIQQEDDLTFCRRNSAGNREEGPDSEDDTNEDAQGSQNNQCVNGKCFQGDCVQQCKALAAGIGTTLTNIIVDATNNIVYCYSNNGEISGDRFPSNGHCEMPNQLDYYGANNTGSNDGDDSYVYFKDVVQPDTECKRIFRNDNVQAKSWNNGCYFRCSFSNGTVLARKYIQPGTLTCGNNYSCLFSKCQRNSCIESCKSAANGETLQDITQEDDDSKEADCFFQGQSTLTTVQLGSPLKCQANYPADKDDDGGGKPLNGITNNNNINNTNGTNTGNIITGGNNSVHNNNNSLSAQHSSQNNGFGKRYIKDTE